MELRLLLANMAPVTVHKVVSFPSFKQSVFSTHHDGCCMEWIMRLRHLQCGSPIPSIFIRYLSLLRLAMAVATPLRAEPTAMIARRDDPPMPPARSLSWLLLGAPPVFWLPLYAYPPIIISFTSILGDNLSPMNHFDAQIVWVIIIEPRVRLPDELQSVDSNRLAKKALCNKCLSILPQLNIIMMPKKTTSD